MESKVLADYGGPYVDAKPISNPQSQVSADKLNRALEDTAQMSGPAVRAQVHFTPVGSGNPEPTFHRSVWGSGSDQKPTITRTGAGVYEIEYAESFVDALNFEETVSFLTPMITMIGDVTYNARVTELAANVATVELFDETDTNSDLDGTETIILWLS